MQHKNKVGLRGLAHGGQGALVLVLGILNGGRRPMQVCPLPALAASMDWLHSAGSSSKRMVWPVGAVSKITISKTVPFSDGHIQEIGEAIKGGHFRRAGTAHLLFHHLDHLRREGSANGRHGAIDVFLRGWIRIDLHGPQIRHTWQSA